MADTPPQRNWNETLLGLVLVVIALGVFGYAAYAIIGIFTRPASGPSAIEASISAYFVDDSGKPLLGLRGRLAT